MDQDADGGASEAAILVEEEQRLGAAEPVDDAFAVGDDVGLKRVGNREEESAFFGVGFKLFLDLI